MNQNDLIALAYLINTLDDNQVTDKRTYILGQTYVHNFIDYYLAHLGLTEFKIAKAYNKPRMNPKSKLDGVDLEQFDDEKIMFALNC